MGKGKTAAQCCHACLGAYKRALKMRPAHVRAWSHQGQAKVVLRVDTVEEMFVFFSFLHFSFSFAQHHTCTRVNREALAEKAEQLHIPNYIVVDAGRTQIAEGSETVLALGVSRVIIGSAAVRHPEFVAEAVKKYGDKIVVGIDAKSETVRTDGWLDDSGENYIAFAERMESYGVKNIIFTDIDKDGMLAGPNFDQLAALRASVSCEIIASGGVSTLEDIAALKKLGIDGAIAGKAVYTGTLDLAKAIKEAE